MKDIEIIEATPINGGFLGRVRIDGKLYDGEMPFQEEFDGEIVDFTSSLAEYYDKKEAKYAELNRFYARFKRVD